MPKKDDLNILARSSALSTIIRIPVFQHVRLLVKASMLFQPAGVQHLLDFCSRNDILKYLRRSINDLWLFVPDLPFHSPLLQTTGNKMQMDFGAPL
jgi:hypothetical protein